MNRYGDKEEMKQNVFKKGKTKRISDEPRKRCMASSHVKFQKMTIKRKPGNGQGAVI